MHNLALLRSLACMLLLAATQVFADADPLYSVECSITPKVKDCKAAKVISTNLNLTEHPLIFPVVSPANETLIVTVYLVQRDEQGRIPVDRKKKAGGPSGIQVDIQDPSRVTVTGSERVVTPLLVFSAQLPYQPKETLPLFENNDFTLSIQVKSNADK